MTNRMLKKQHTMKKILFILVAVSFFAACEKEYPKSLFGGYGIPATYTNNYLLTGIHSNFVNENLYSEPIFIDSSAYHDFYIQVNLFGEMVSENVYFSDIEIDESLPPYASYLPIEQRYFINKIKHHQLLVNNELCSNYEIYKQNEQKKYEKYHLNEALGCSPFYIIFPKSFSLTGTLNFKLVLKDIHDNEYTANIDNVLIEQEN